MSQDQQEYRSERGLGFSGGSEGSTMASRRSFVAALAGMTLMPVVGREAFARRRQDVVTGTNTGATILRLAVPEFVPRSTEGDLPALAARFSETLWNDLEFSGVAQLISRSFYPIGQFGEPQDIVPDDWISDRVGAEFLAFGNASVRAGQLVIEARLWDMKAPILDRETLGQSLRSGELTERSVRLMAHTFADLVVGVLGGGIRGVARTQIAFESKEGNQDKSIFVMDYDGENARQITAPGVLAVTPNWSPDGTRIAFTSYERNQADIAIISPVDRRGFPFEIFPGTNASPAFAPDGMRIAFASGMRELRGQPDMEIYVSDVQGRNLRRLTSSVGVDTQPSWNPRTGQQLAFVSDRGGTPQIYIVDAEGGNLRRLIAESGEATDPAWSPDGARIAFSWQPSGEPTKDIYVHELSSGRNVQLTGNSGYNENPSWSPDGRHLAFESSRDGVVQIYSMLANGSQVRRLTTQGRNTNPSWSNYMG